MFRSQISPAELQAHQHREIQAEADTDFITSEVKAERDVGLALKARGTFTRQHVFNPQ